jgi:hypothetical protein
LKIGGPILRCIDGPITETFVEVTGKMLFFVFCLVAQCLDRFLDKRTGEELRRAGITADRFSDTQTSIPAWARHHITSSANLNCNSSLKDWILTKLAKIRDHDQMIDTSELDDFIMLAAYRRQINGIDKEGISSVSTSAHKARGYDLHPIRRSSYFRSSPGLAYKGNKLSSSQEHIIVGDSYVHGLMYEEGMEIVKSGKMYERDFVLI